VNKEEVLLETLNFQGRMLIERGKAYTNADGFAKSISSPWHGRPPHGPRP